MCSCSQVIRETKIKASRKERICMASICLRDIMGLSNNPFTFAEYKAVVRAKQNGWKIKRGEPYIEQILIGDDGFYSFKAIPEIHAICLKYDVYPEC